jgi:hypothetical protein
MPLTEEQENELQQLKAERDRLLTPEVTKQIQELEEPLAGTSLLGVKGLEELDRLKQERIDLLKKAQDTVKIPRSLIQDLGMAGPFDAERPEPPQVTGIDPLGVQKSVFDKRNELITRRQSALGELRKGFTDEQIQNAFNINRIEQEAAGTELSDFIPIAVGTAAGIGAGLITGGPDPSDIATVPFVARHVANLIRSGATGIGTFGGELLRQKITGEEIDFRKAGKIASTDALLDFGTGTIVDKIGRSIAPFRQSIIPEAQEFAEDFARVGRELGEEVPFRITPAQLTESGTVDTFETIAESAPLGRGGVRSLKKVLIPEQFKRYTAFKQRELADGLAILDAKDLSPIIDDAIRGEKGTLTIAKIAARRNYAAVDALTKDARIDIRPLKKWAQKQLDESAKIGGRKFGTSATKGLNDILVSNDFLTYELGSELRSSYLSDVPALKFLKDKDATFMSVLAGKVDDLITAPGTLTGEAEAMRNIANKFWRENFGTGIVARQKVGKFQTKVIKDMIRAIDQREPDKLVGLVFKKGAREKIELTKEVLGKKAFSRLRSTWLDKVIRTSSDAEGVLRGNVFLNNINRMEPQTLDIIFPNKAHLDDVMRIGLGARIIQQPTGGAGQFVVQQAQFGALAALAAGVAKGSPRRAITALSIIGLPKLFAAIINSPAASNLMVKGLNLPLGSKAASSMFARAIRTISDDKEQANEVLDEIQEMQRKLQGQ